MPNLDKEKQSFMEDEETVTMNGNNGETELVSVEPRQEDV